MKIRLQPEAINISDGQARTMRVHGAGPKRSWVYRRTPRGRGRETNKNARVTGTAKTPRFETDEAIVSKLGVDEFFFISQSTDLQAVVALKK